MKKIEKNRKKNITTSKDIKQAKPKKNEFPYPMKIAFAYYNEKEKKIKFLFDAKRVEEQVKGVTAFYNTIEMLSYNEAFIQEIIKIRRNLGIPIEGFSFLDCKNSEELNKKYLGKTLIQEADDSKKYIKLIPDAINELLYEYNITPWLDQERINIAMIILYNMVKPVELIPITHYEGNEDSIRSRAGVFIQIHKSMGKTPIKDYIDKEWDKDLGVSIKTLENYKCAGLTALDKDLLNLRHKNWSYEKIADKHGENPDIKLKGDGKFKDLADATVFIERYSRLQEKIISLFKKRDQYDQEQKEIDMATFDF